MLVIGVHTLPPRDRPYANRHAEQLQALAKRIRIEKRPVIVLGDFNSTPWSSRYRRFLDEAGLVSSVQGFGAPGTWPAMLPMRIPIDHVLHSPSLRTVDRRVGPSVGSDHLAVTAVLAPNKP